MEKIELSKNLPEKVHEVWNSKLKQKRSNYHISYSQLSVFHTCKKRWYLEYYKKLAPYRASIHSFFGTSMHETIQEWLTVLYHDSVGSAENMNLTKHLYEGMLKNYRIEKAKNGHQPFSNPDELKLFNLNGINILEYLKKNRTKYYPTRGLVLAGIETLLYQEISPGIFFKGFVDIVMYDKKEDMWYIIDLKTSTKGWGKWAKEDELKLSQMRLYKIFFSKQFNIPLNKIKTEYQILKREVPVDAPYAAMQKRIQIFKPASGKAKVKEAYKYVQDFIEEVFDEDGKVVDEPKEASPSKNACRFCPFLNTSHCSVGIS